MEKPLSYTNADGFLVFTSEYLKKRGHCCKSLCLHCPYGFTIKKLGFEFSIYKEDQLLLEQCGVSADALCGFLPQDILIIGLKGVQCGLLTKDHIRVKKIFLKEEFKDQGISLELIESYLFI